MASTVGSFGEFQTDHLILLVGTNPLPNYVAGRLLAGTNGTIHLLSSEGNTDRGMSIQPIKGRQFEFDIAAMRGHQLFAISCTTDSSKPLRKAKLIEAFVRARQLGGDEARVALVCAYGDPAALEAEIAEDWFTVGRVRVFGRPDLTQLAEKLTRWFNREG